MKRVGGVTRGEDRLRLTLLLRDLSGEDDRRKSLVGSRSATFVCERAPNLDNIFRQLAEQLEGMES